jgi:hypothetical protein
MPGRRAAGPPAVRTAAARWQRGWPVPVAARAAPAIPARPAGQGMRLAQTRLRLGCPAACGTAGIRPRRVLRRPGSPPRCPAERSLGPAASLAVRVPLRSAPRRASGRVRGVRDADVRLRAVRRRRFRAVGWQLRPGAAPRYRRTAAVGAGPAAGRALLGAERAVRRVRGVVAAGRVARRVPSRGLRRELHAAPVPAMAPAAAGSARCAPVRAAGVVPQAWPPVGALAQNRSRASATVGSRSPLRPPAA